MNNMDQNNQYNSNIHHNPQNPSGQPDPQPGYTTQGQGTQGHSAQGQPNQQQQPGSSDQGTHQQSNQSHSQDPQFEQALKNAWNAFHARQQEIEAMAQKPEIPHDVIESLKAASKRQLDEDIYQIYSKSNPNTQQQESQKQDQWRFGEKFHSTDTSKLYKFYRAEKGRMVAGVCMGLSEYFNIEVGTIRLVVIICSICGLVVSPLLIVPIAYIIAAILLPMKSEVEAKQKNDYAL